MNRWQADVKAFHREMDLPVGAYPPEIRRPDLRAKLIMEEAAETCRALTGRGVEYSIEGVVDERDDFNNLQPQDLIEAIDGMVDTMVVILGTAIEMGVDLDPFWDEVQRANMAKAGGPVRDDGKQLKPEGWTPPDHSSVLLRTYGLTVS